MKNKTKKKEQLETEMLRLRNRVGELESIKGRQKEVEEALREREERYRTLFEESPISLWEQDCSELKAYFDRLRESGIKDFRSYFENHPEIVAKLATMFEVIYVNKATLSFYEAKGQEELITSLPKVFIKETYELFKESQAALAEGRTEFENEGIVQTLSGEKKYFTLKWSIVPGHEETLSKMLVSCIDITARKKADDALQRSEKNYSTLVESSLTGIYVDQREKITFCNNRFAEIYGCSKEELGGRKITNLIYPDDRTLIEKARKKILKGGESAFVYEARGITQDGEVKWIIWRSTRIEYKGKVAILGNIVDITARKQTEDALRKSEQKLRFLSSQLLTAQEKERRRISRELHDELGQSLSFLKLQVRSMEKKLQPEQTSLKEDCTETRAYIDGIIENVRRLSRDLGPSAIEDLGLSASLRWLIDHFIKHYDIRVSFDAEKIDHAFSLEDQVNIFRVFQEAFTNIAKHAEASKINVAIRRSNANTSFLIEDDGKGFNVKKVLTKDFSEKGLGLTTMDERVRMLGGVLKISNKKNKGTQLRFILPIKERR